MRKRLAVVFCAIAVLGLTGGSAFAGEITGNGKWIAGSEQAPLNGRSECAYSGQNDEYQLGDASASRTQSWGSDFASEGVHAGVPGFACNPSGARG
jgi:hypothetical protein